MTHDQLPLENDLRQKAITRLKKRRDFHAHLLVYALVNAFLVLIWAFATPDVFFWPIFAIVGWGIGVVMNAWDVYFASEIDEASIQREIEHLQQRH